MVIPYKICVLFVFLFEWVVSAQHNGKIFDIVSYGAIADGKTDCSKIFEKVWKDACTSTEGATILVPSGTFLTGVTVFEGPCKGKIEFEIIGILKAPTDLNLFKDTWIKFRHINGLSVGGGGTLDGVGASAWPHNDCKKNRNCRALPANLRFDFVTNATISDIHSLDSKILHINVFACESMTFNYITIKAPGDSPNTDGIHIGNSSFVDISHSVISTGDDCISFSPGSKNINVNNITCGPGHGISIGSLGGTPHEESVMGLIVRNCTFISTSNGARIKTWAPSQVNHAYNITFEELIMEDVQNPIVIDQNYCPNGACDHKSYSSVTVKDIHYRNIRGTSASKVAVNLACSPKFPCEDIELNKIDLSYTGNKGHESALMNCSNVKGIVVDKQYPPSCF